MRAYWRFKGRTVGAEKFIQPRAKPQKHLLCCGSILNCTVVEVYYSNVVHVDYTIVINVYYTTVIEVYYTTDYIRRDIGSISENGSLGITNSNP